MTTSAEAQSLTDAFEAHTIDPAAFGHEEHVRVAYEFVKRYGFVDGATRYANCIKAISEQAGHPGRYHVTVTYAFFSLIAERMATRPSETCDAFLANNPDLLSKGFLDAWYPKERLASDLARRIFVLPQPAG